MHRSRPPTTGLLVGLLIALPATFASSAARAQPARPAPPNEAPAPPAQPAPAPHAPPNTQPYAQPNQPRVPSFYHPTQRHEFLLRVDPAYREAYEGRRMATILTIVGGGVGLTTMAIGAFSFLYTCTLDSLHDGTVNNCSVTPLQHVLLWGGLGLTAISLAFGISSAVSDHNRVKAIRSRYPIVFGASLAPGGGGVQLSLRF